MQQLEPSKLYIIDSNNNYEYKSFTVNNKLWNYLNSLIKNLDTYKFKGYFKKTMSMYPKFKTKTLIDEKEINDYFRRCNFLSLLQIMGMITNLLPQYNNSIGLIKIGPSKDGKKNCCIIDDSSVLDKDNNEIRDTDGSNEERHRGHRLFYYELTIEQREEVIVVFDNMLQLLKSIILRINCGQYIMFDPIYTIQRIVCYAAKNNMINFIDYMSWEIHDSPYLLSYEEKLNLFKDYDTLYNMWYNNFITNNQGKLRLFILCVFYIDLINTEQINDGF
jgi:hypothetical protein